MMGKTNAVNCIITKHNKSQEIAKEWKPMYNQVSISVDEIATIIVERTGVFGEEVEKVAYDIWIRSNNGRDVQYAMDLAYSVSTR